MTSPKANAGDLRWMDEAISLASRATGRTHPNPLVGCVIVDGDGRVVGRGFHARAGEDHAEIAAIKDADTDLTDCTLYVNHEPCCHHGRTPPCTDAIIDAGISRVVIGTIDPNPRVSGRGKKILEQAGIDVLCGVRHDASRWLNAPFFKYMTVGLPWVAAKWAMSLDGKIATHVGDSRWITGESARRRVHELRDTYDAILVGKQTLLADDPRLTCRLEDGRDPVRFVVDARLEAPVEHRVFHHHDSDAPTIVFCAPEPRHLRRRALEERGVEIVEIETDQRGWLQPRAMLEAIHRRELLSVLVEGGGQLLGSFFDAGLIDYAYAFVAPRLIGGDQAPTPLAGRGIESMEQCLDLRQPAVEQLSGDLLVHGHTTDFPTLSGREEATQE